MEVYHYTTSDCLNSIITNKRFHPSSFVTSDDSTYGPGWYFTDLVPSTNVLELLWYLWNIKDNPWGFALWAKSYIEYEIADRYLEYCRPHVYRLRHDVLEDEKHLTIQQNYVDKDKNVVIRYVRHGER